MGLVVSVGATVLEASPAAADTFTDPGFASETVATVSPYTLVGLTFAPDGRMFVWQKNGVVRIIKNGVLLPTPFIDLSSHVNTFDDRGFWGLALDPNFASNGYVYMSYTYENAGDPNDTNAKTARLTRVTANPSNPDVALPGETVIMGSVGTPPCSAQPAGADCLAADAGSHSIGNLRFLDDGTLLVGMGDGADGGATDPLPLRAQDLTSANGKIMRINKDGTAPTDNPFYDGTNDVRSKVWLYGVRNPFRFDVQPGTGDIWFGDVGWNTWEEVNHGTKGSNHGWPCWEGNSVNTTYSTTSVCANLAQSSVTMPYDTYNHSTGSTAVIGGPFYEGTAYPQQYRDNWFYADYTGNWIKRVTFDSAHNPTGIQTFATNVQAPVSLAVGPDGLLYYLSFTTGQINRIRSNGPAASATATPTYGASPLAVSFSSAGTTNPAGGSLTYSWDFGDGTTSTQANPAHTYTVSGVHAYTASLKVTDSAGSSSTATVRVTVNSTPPVPTISTPTDGTSVQPGQTVTFSGSANDPEEGALPASALSWTVLLHHNQHVHTFVGGTGSSGSFVAENHGAIGTYSYEIILTATDSSGLSASRSVNLPVIADTVPPSAPAGLIAAASSGFSSIDLGWQASTDDNAVAGYQVERCQGAGCTNFVQLATAPTGTSMTDTGLQPSTTYQYRVRAADVMGNVGDYSNVATATTNAAPPPVPGLVAGYTFDATSGSTVTDMSGNGNAGTINGGASWSTGKYGGALRFDGVSNRVSVPASSSLNVSAAMTLMAWIEPTVSQSGWRTIMQKESDAYFLNASNSTGALRPSGGATVGGSTSWLSGPTASPVNAWTHVAMTYDGTTMRLYVNGVQVTSIAASGTIQNTTNPLSIGANTPYGEYFAGLIDEARVYNRALTATEIQSAMNNPLVPPAPDITAPTAPSALTATASNASQVNLSWSASTDNVAVTGYRVERCQGAGCTGFTQVGTATGLSFSDTGLSANTTYLYRVRAVDAAGNASAYSGTATATTPAPDTTPPTAPSGLTATATGPTAVSLTWAAATDDVAATGYRVERCAGAGCTGFTQVGTPTGLGYSDTGLSANTTYVYRVRAVDAAGNLSPYSATATATTPTAPDTTAPTAPTGLTATPAGTSQINLAWTASTDNVGVTQYRVERCSGTSCTTWAQVDATTSLTSSSTGLAANTVYRFRVRAADAAGNLSAYSAIVSARTAAADTTRPTAPTGLTAAAAGPTRVNLAWTASTDNVGVTGYRVERCQGSGCTGFAEIAQPTTTSYADTTTAASTVYRYRVRATDAAGNLSTYSSVVTVTTPSVPDTTPPTVPSGLTVSAGASTLMNVAWTASTDNVGVTSYVVERCQGTGCTTFSSVGTPTTPSYADGAVLPATSYSYRVKALDAAGNASAYSTIVSATTPAGPAVPAGLVAGWTFDAGSGSTVADVSGNGNTGTITGATWVGGKYGGALSFNGTNARVNVPASASLNLTSAMTLMAWIEPTLSQSGWRTIMQKESDAYFLNASNSTGALRPSGGATVGGSTSWLSGPTASPVNAWTHVAMTYDGTTMRLYVNGVQVTSIAASGTIQNTSNPLSIGGNTPYGEYFAGLIDEARVYNRVLSPTDIQAAMNTPLN
ncbi:hypothetical protein JCM18899A_49620 [Nocardioides sp. AN3]